MHEKSKILLLICATVLGVVFGANESRAQYAYGGGSAYYGAGISPGASSCSYKPDIGDEATSIQDDIDDATERQRNLKQDLADAKKDLRDVQKDLKDAKRDFGDRGLKEDYANFLDSYIGEGKDCCSYSYEGATNAPVCPQTSGQDQNTPKESPSPFKATDWARMCDKNGRVKASEVCSDKTPKDNKVDVGFDKSKCLASLQKWEDAKPKLKTKQDKVDQLNKEIEEVKDELKKLKREKTHAISDYQKEKQEELTEGGCEDCNLAGNGSGSRGGGGNGPSQLGQTIGNVALAAGAMLLGSSTEKYVSKQNAMLGFSTQTTPSLFYGFPFLQGALYGAVSGGGGQGAFGCAGSASGGGAFANGMNGLGGLGSIYGNPMGGGGGAFGYPNSMYGNPYGGGMFSPGIGTGGLAGPWGLGGGGGGYNPYGALGVPVGGFGGGGYLAGGYPAGAVVGSFSGGGLGFIASGGGGGYLAGGYPAGAVVGSFSGGGLGFIASGGGGYPSGGGYPLGGGIAGYAAGGFSGYLAGGVAGGLSGYNPYAAQVAQQQMQLQLQAYQAQLQAEQQYQQNMANRQQVVGGLASEIQSLNLRLQAAESGLYDTNPYAALSGTGLGGGIGGSIGIGGLSGYGGISSYGGSPYGGLNSSGYGSLNSYSPYGTGIGSVNAYGTLGGYGTATGINPPTTYTPGSINSR